MEIERKFLVAEWPDIAMEAVPIRQGYVTDAADSVELRLRQSGAAWFLTVKSDGGLVRAEYEIPIAAAHFETLWPATEGRRVEKTRHTGLLQDGSRFELDVFEGHLAPLMLVEVEFASVAAAEGFVPPAWFGREVTEDRRYRNKALALARP